MKTNGRIEDNLDKLIRNRVRALYINEDANMLVFNTRPHVERCVEHVLRWSLGAPLRPGDDCACPIKSHTDHVVWLVEPSCCATGYFDEIEGIENLLSHRILSIDIKEVDRIESSDDVQDIHAVDIKTDNGICTLFMRSEHNGYYGADIMDATTKTYNQFMLDERNLRVNQNFEKVDRFEPIRLCPITTNGKIIFKEKK